MPRKSIIVIMSAAFVLFAAVITVLILTQPESGAGKTGTSASVPAVSDAASAGAVEPSEAVTDPMGEDAGQFIIAYKYPFHSYQEALALTDEQLNENIADLEKQYNQYLETCRSEELKSIAAQRYEQAVKQLQNYIKIKNRTPEDQRQVHEQAFYAHYNALAEKCGNPERYGLRAEDIQERMHIAERAKRYYEEGVITIEQACQAVGLTSANLPYDPTFSLPD